MANISLEGSIRTCKVDTAWANRLESDRFLNPNLMVCPAWNGIDTAGRPASEFSFYSKTAGCNSAADRVNLENDLRPQYMEYVTLDAAGIRGGCSESRPKTDAKCGQSVMGNAHNITGQFGTMSGFSQVYPSCQSCQLYPDQRAYQSQNARSQQYAQNAAAVQNYRQYY
jgi:hypothetical protein